MNAITTDLIQIDTLTNLHVGSGDASYGIVDKLVQRDPSTRFPVINGSSFKGAIKEYSEEVPEFTAALLKYVFGSTKKKEENVIDRSEEEVEDEQEIKKDEKAKSNENKNGAFKFFTAQLLSIPVRSNMKPFYHATCPFIVKEFIDSINSFGLKPHLISKYTTGLKTLENKLFNENVDFFYFGNKKNNFLIEEYENGSCFNLDEVQNSKPETIITELFGPKDSFVFLRDDHFMELCENLPVIARNRIAEEKKNLWYEEVVPRGSKFYSFVLRPDNTDSKSFILNFQKNLNETPLQIGANATVGYGFCQFKTIE